jgi:hypothetical protein
MSKSTFPALHRNDCGARLEQVQGYRIAQSKSDAIVHLERIFGQSGSYLITSPHSQLHAHQFANGGSGSLWVLGNSKDTLPDGGVSDGLSARCASLQGQSITK